MTFRNILKEFQENSFNTTDQGRKFEHMILRWFKTTNLYKDIISDVWMIKDFTPLMSQTKHYIGIDPVAKTKEGKFGLFNEKLLSDIYDETYPSEE